MAKLDLEGLGFRLLDDGWIRRSNDPLNPHLRHTTMFYNGREWRVNGLGIAGPTTPEELTLLVKLVFGCLHYQAAEPALSTEEVTPLPPNSIPPEGGGFNHTR